MKNTRSFIIQASLTLLFVIFVGVFSCSDLQGDGIGTVIWEGTVLPEDSCYRNPVWEPDLSYPSVFSAAVGYFALGIDNEWSPGLYYNAPVLSSNDLMRWRLRGEALTEQPDWAEGSITRISAGFSRILGTYFVFYQLGENGIGMGGSKAPQGPYEDYGLIMTADSVGLSDCSNPFFFPFGSSAYLFFQGGDGIYGVKLILKRTGLADLDGDPFKITGQHIHSINMARLNNVFYLFGTSDSGEEGAIVTGRSPGITGPFLDKDNTGLTANGGTTFFKGSSGNGFINVDHVGGVFEDANKDVWMLYHTTDIDQPELTSGADRRPLMLSRIVFDDTGWPSGITEAAGGWNYPKFMR
jgi:arabinan endo-1,5-alpha-L-arabinosidase